MFGQFLADFSVLTNRVELRRVSTSLSEAIENGLAMQLIATECNR
jgi:hypothetical protein